MTSCIRWFEKISYSFFI